MAWSDTNSRAVDPPSVGNTETSAGYRLGTALDPISTAPLFSTGGWVEKRSTEQQVAKGKVASQDSYTDTLALLLIHLSIRIQFDLLGIFPLT